MAGSHLIPDSSLIIFKASSLDIAFLCALSWVRAQYAPAKPLFEEIKTMPNYFEPYDTTVHFISEQELKENHSEIPHGGFVIRVGNTAGNKNHIIEYSLKLESNPEFTSSVIVAYARAAHRMYKEGMSGCKTVFDIPPAYLSSMSDEELRARLL